MDEPPIMFTPEVWHIANWLVYVTAGKGTPERSQFLRLTQECQFIYGGNSFMNSAYAWFVREVFEGKHRG